MEKKIARVTIYTKVTGEPLDWTVEKSDSINYFFADDGSNEKPLELLGDNLGLDRNANIDAEPVEKACWVMYHEPDRKPLGEIELMEWDGKGEFVDGARA